MPTQSRKNIVKKLDAVFSTYIRLRESKNEIAQCYTCGKKDNYKKLQCGHFQSRKHYSTRWDETNCQVQCYACNVARYGEQYIFGNNLNAEYGENTSDKLLKKSRDITKFSNADLLGKIDMYKNKIKDLQVI